jgi:homoserine/homoserine lactone efflux protein
MSLELYLFFLVTTVMLIMVPGPAAITVAAQGASHNSRSAFLGIMGVATADAFFFALSATGIATLILASNLLFSVIKWVGVAYLIYLGLSAIFSKAGAIRIDQQTKADRSTKTFYQGLVVQLANPKALMYFSALLPQFIDPNEPIMQQMLIMGLTCVIADILVYSVFSRMGAQLAKQQVKAWVIGLINKAAGVALIVTGIRMATLENSK